MSIFLYMFHLYMTLLFLTDGEKMHSFYNLVSHRMGGSFAEKVKVTGLGCDRFSH